MSVMLTTIEAAMTKRTRNFETGALVKPEVSIVDGSGGASDGLWSWFRVHSY